MSSKSQHNVGHWSERAKKALDELPRVTSDLMDTKILLQQTDSALRAERKANAGLLVEVANLRSRLDKRELKERELEIELGQSNSALSALAEGIADERRKVITLKRNQCPRWLGFISRFYR